LQLWAQITENGDIINLPRTWRVHYNQEMNPAYVDYCKLLRRSATGKWLEMKSPVLPRYTSEKCSFYCTADNGEVAVFPFSNVKRAVLVNTSVVAFEFSDSLLAVQCSTSAGVESMVESLETSGVKVHKSTGYEDSTPRLDDPDVQEFILKQLFSRDFQQFVEQLKQLLRGMHDSVPK
jgi:hypothetical protein